MQVPSPVFLISALFQASRRFPAAMLIAFLGTLACLGLLSGGGIDGENFYIRNWLVCQLGLPLLTGLVAFAESKSWPEFRTWTLQILGVLALVGCWFWLDPKAEAYDWKIIPQYIALLAFLHLAVAVAPYLNQLSVRDFWEYNRQLFGNFIVGAAFTLILFAGLALGVLAVDILFDLDVDYRLYSKLFVILAGIFNPAYFLYHFPKQYQSENTESEAYNWVFRNLCKYILIPIVILYFLILYTYGAKVGLQWSLPKGWISALVIGFSVAGIFTYLLNFYLETEDESLLVKGFKRWFWWVLLPLTGLLFIAIGKRISDYGVTEERFLIAELGVWLAVVSLYFLFSKKDNLKFIPISLGLFTLLWAFGPLSAFQVSERSQKGILTRILTQNGRFENGKMKPGNSPLTEPEQDQASSGILYLEYRGGYQDLLPLPLDSALLEYNGLRKWLNIGLLSPDSAYEIQINPNNSDEPFKISGYDMAYPVDFYQRNDDDSPQETVFFKCSKDGKNLEWWQKKEGKAQLVESFSLEPALQKWAKLREENSSNTFVSLSIQERTFVFYGKKGNLCWIAEDADLQIKGDEKTLGSSTGLILLKTK